MQSPPTSKPLGRSPLHYRLTREGAVFSEYSGWLVADHFGNAQDEAESARSAAALGDFSFAGKWDIQGAGLERSLRRIVEGTAVPRPRRATACEGGYLCRLMPDRALLVLDRADAEISTKLRELGGSTCLHSVDRTSGYGRLLLCGPQARLVLSKVTPLDLRGSTFPDFSCAWTPMAGIRVLLARRDRRRLPGYEVLVSREYAEYFSLEG